MSIYSKVKGNSFFQGVLFTLAAIAVIIFLYALSMFFTAKSKINEEVVSVAKIEIAKEFKNTRDLQLHMSKGFSYNISSGGRGNAFFVLCDENFTCYTVSASKVGGVWKIEKIGEVKENDKK